MNTRQRFLVSLSLSLPPLTPLQAVRNVELNLDSQFPLVDQGRRLPPAARSLSLSRLTSLKRFIDPELASNPSSSIRPSTPTRQGWTSSLFQRLGIQLKEEVRKYDGIDRFQIWTAEVKRSKDSEEVYPVLLQMNRPGVYENAAAHYRQVLLL